MVKKKKSIYVPEYLYYYYNFTITILGWVGLECNIIYINIISNNFETIYRYQSVSKYFVHMIKSK